MLMVQYYNGLLLCCFPPWVVCVTTERVAYRNKETHYMRKSPQAVQLVPIRYQCSTIRQAFLGVEYDDGKTADLFTSPRAPPSLSRRRAPDRSSKASSGFILPLATSGCEAGS